MKSFPSVKIIGSGDQLVRRKGRLVLINKKHPKRKRRQA